MQKLNGHFSTSQTLFDVPTNNRGYATTEFLRQNKNLLNITKLAKIAGIKSDAVLSAVRYNHQLTMDESMRLTAALEKCGFRVI
ncbi:MAG: hypothetical protein MUF71_07855 [Candidatus Kapabacteria bacterium]|jgi:hypothetical protein|nr:hypothetical protein [Candidatus Kapabacteria bacterium]